MVMLTVPMGKRVYLYVEGLAEPIVVRPMRLTARDHVSVSFDLPDAVGALREDLRDDEVEAGRDPAELARRIASGETKGRAQRMREPGRPGGYEPIRRRARRDDR